MSRRKANIVLLYEDARHRSVLHRWLQTYRHINSGKIRDVHGRNNHGVDKRLGEEIEVLQSRQNHNLIVVRDADHRSVQDQISRLQRQIAESGIAPHRVAFVIPAFNIESWIEFAETGATAIQTGDIEVDRQARETVKRKYPGSGTERCKSVASKLEDHFMKIRQNQQMGSADLESLWLSAQSLAELSYECE